jgi:hypothetical protein
MSLGPSGVLVRIPFLVTDKGSILPPLGSDGHSLVDVTAMTVVVIDPTGTATTSTVAGGGIIHDSLGTYHLLVDTTAKPGHWTYRETSPSPVQSACEGAFDIDP